MLALTPLRYRISTSLTARVAACSPLPAAALPWRCCSPCGSSSRSSLYASSMCGGRRYTALSFFPGVAGHPLSTQVRLAHNAASVSATADPPLPPHKKKAAAPKKASPFPALHTGALDGTNIPIGRVLKLVFSYLWPHGDWWMKAMVVCSLSCVLSAKLLKVTLPFAFKAIVDSLSITTTDTALATAVATVGPLTLTACGFVAAYGVCRVAGSFAEECKNIFFAPVGGAASTKLAMRMVKKLHDLDLPFHINRETGVLTKDLDRGSRAFWNLAYLLLFMVIPTTFEMGLVGTALYTQGGGPFIGIACSAVVAYVSWTLVVTNWRAKFRARFNHYDSVVGGRIVDSLLNYETVKYFGMEAYECKRIEEKVQQMNGQLVVLDQSIAVLNVGQQLIFAAAAVSSLYLATCGVIAGTMTVGDLVLIDGLLLQLYMPLSFLGMIYRDLQSSTQNMQAMIALLDVESEVVDAPDAKPYVHHDGTIQLNNVSFQYAAPPQAEAVLEGSSTPAETSPPEPLQEAPPLDATTTAAAAVAAAAITLPKRRVAVLRDLSLKIPGGSVVAFVGPSGSGKSTIFRLLFRFFNASGGQILLDGQALSGLTIQSVRKSIGVIPQDPILFNESVRYNIAYSRPTASDAEVERVARMANLHDTVRSMPDGYDTRVGERGGKLSGGEKQRVAIARALLDDRPILLADEATSALDNSTEAEVMRALRSPTLSGGKRTVLLIAHRLTTVQLADIIFVLGDGCLQEYGTHAELLSQGGTYSTLWRRQQEEKEEEQQRAGGKPAAPA